MRPWLLAAATYLAGALVFTWPLVGSLSEAVWGDRFDAWTTMWLIWHLAERLGAGELGAVTDRIFFPVGYNLWSFGHLALQLLAAPLIWLGCSVPTAYNLLLLGSFTGTGLAGHALGRRLSGDHWGGLLCGAVFTWSPFLYGEMSAGCVELVAAWFFPLQALLMLRLFDAPTWRRALPVGALLAATGPFNWYYTVFTGMLLLAMLGWRIAAGGSALVPTLTRAAAAIGGAALINLPLIPLVRQETPERFGIAAESFSAENWELSKAITNGRVPLAELDLNALVVNDAMQVVINSTTLSDLVAAGFPANPLESTPGAVALALGLFGLVAAGRRGLGWAAIAAVFTGLTLGPFLLVDATPPLPAWSEERPLPYYYLYNSVPFFSKAYRPYRLGVVALTALAALAALGFGRVKGRWKPGLAIGVFVFAAMQPHVRLDGAGAPPSTRPLGDARIPEAYTALAALPPGAVIELPLQYQPVSVANARLQYFQVAHQRPMLNCNQLIRRTELLQFKAYVGGNNFLQTVLDIGRSAPPWTWSEADVEALVRDGFGYVIAHVGFTPAQLRLSGYRGEADRLRQPAWAMLSESFGEPVLAQDGLLVYDLRALRGARTWTGEDYVEVTVPWTALKLPVTLREGDTIPLDAPAHARAFSAWLHRLAGEGGVSLVHGSGWSAPLLTPEGQWRWSEVPDLPELGSASWALQATGGSVTLELDALQFRVDP